ncbi:FGGY-family carbohydrate kinase [Nioella aestuarii]|uniref:FGGY-family carbohydrate kinase n=1 Tax=Nioella aestuarii TaxID=1662864 RepID=UPI003D7FA6CC
MTHIAVIDIGKTNAKLALVDRATLSEVAVVTRPNTVLAGPPWPHFDLEGHWDFLLDSLASFHAAHLIDAISITTHGASCVLLDTEGGLAAPMLDYEHPGPDDLSDTYDRLRPSFRETGSARLSGGLNMGAQLHWMFTQDPTLKDRTAQILTYPQYWAFRLTGIAATERTSLGCHTDLWCPDQDAPSSLVRSLGIDDKIAPVRMASDILGTITSQVATRTGLPADTPVTCGIHDSNASLLPHLLARTSPFSVVSTGTWIIAMTVGGTNPSLDPDRDTLINVNAFGRPVPSARFMGGREFEQIVAGVQAVPTSADVDAVLANGTMLMPAVEQSTGPFAGCKSVWLPQEPDIGTGQRSVAAAYYCAMVTATCLSLTGHQGDIVVEGPFAGNMEFLSMLTVATGCSVIAAENATGTSQGAALLICENSSQPVDNVYEITEAERTILARYAANWRKLCARNCMSQLN